MVHLLKELEQMQLLGQVWGLKRLFQSESLTSVCIGLRGHKMTIK